MMFELIMNMPVRSSGAAVHRIIGSHKTASSIEDLLTWIDRHDFLVVEEWYPNDQNVFENRGQVALNRRFIGKIKVWGKS